MYRSHKFLESALTQDGFQISTAEVGKWIEEQRAQVNVQVDIVPLDSLENWSHDSAQGQIVHDSGALRFPVSRFKQIGGASAGHSQLSSKLKSVTLAFL